MGKASSLFYNPNDSEAETLYRRITPTEEQCEEQQARWNNLADFLKEALREKTGYSISTWLQGSYKFGTQTKPVGHVGEFDVDLGVYFKWAGEAEDGRYTPQQLRNFVQECLEEYKSENADDVIEVINPPKPRCCRIRFKGDFHIDVPCYHLDPDRDARKLAADGGWEESDPKALYLWFRDSSENYRRSKVRRTIQYTKCWAALKFTDDEGRPSSVLLTVLVADAFDDLSDTEVAADDDALTAVLEKMVERLKDSTEVPNPANAAEDLASRLSDEEMDNFLSKLREFQGIAQAASNCDTKLEAADKWSEAFDHHFPMPEQEEASESATSALVTMLNINVKAIAVARNNPNQRFEGMNKIGPIPKDCSIDFEIMNPENLPPHASVQWVVRNTGEEAEYVNDMGHRTQLGQIRNSERSAYRGTHYMDCVVKQFGKLIGYRRVPVTITGMAMPRRNPAVRPFWRSFA